MTVCRIAIPVILGLIATPALGASFDCARASTPFEHAICDIPDLSAADEVLAKAFATATGGLTKDAVTLMRADQRNWLAYAQRACTDDAQPMTTGRYDDEAGICLVDLFTARSRELENSRMQGGHRFYLSSAYAALPDPAETGNPDSYWKVATHETVFPQLDFDDAQAGPFNDFVRDTVALETELMPPVGEGLVPALDGSGDTSLSIAVQELVPQSRISLRVTSYWYGHGAAHGNWTVSYIHYSVPEQRGLIASDMFSGADWASTLVDLAWEQLQIEHKDWLQVETAGDIAEAVVEPSRWDLSDDYGLVIQFQPYEVAAYAYGAPTITIPWDRLDGIKSDDQDFVRYGF